VTGVNTYSGGTNVVSGAIVPGNISALGSGPLAVSTLALVNLNGSSLTVGPLSGAGTIDDFTGAGTPVLTLGGTASTTFSGVIANTTGAVSVVQAGTGNLVLTGTNTYTGSTTINAGSVELGNGGTSGSVAGSIIDNTSLLIDRSDTAVTFANAISGTGSVSNVGLGSVTFTGANSYSNGTNVNAGTLVIGAAGALPSGKNVSVLANSALVINAASTAGVIANAGAVAVNANTTVTQITGNTGSLTIGTVSTPAALRLAFTSSVTLGPATTVGALNISTGSQLNITNHDVFIKYGAAADPIATIQADLSAAYNSSAGKYVNPAGSVLPITSSTATGAAAGDYVIGYLDNPTSSPLQVDTNGPTLPADTLEIGFTVPGDTDLNGSVNFQDLVNVAKHIGVKGAGLTWVNGDVDYAGSATAINFNDLVIVAKGIGNSLTKQQAHELPTSIVAQYNLALLEIGNGGTSSVPEPGMVSLLAIGAGGLLARRRRRTIIDRTA
jgi:autotransporter-associated beta strand protein